MKKYKSGDPIKYARKELYKAAMMVTAKHLRKDAEEVKAVRDAYVYTYTGTTYDLLSYEDMQRCTDVMLSKVVVSDWITAFQKKKLWLEMIRYALYYADFKKIIFVDKETGEVQTGSELQENMQMLFEAKEQLPTTVLSSLCEKCINTKSNRLLIEGGYKLFCKAENKMDYTRLSSEAANYLIKRYQSINAEVEKKVNYSNAENKHEFQLN